ncbi:predicted protein [Plenodomus lingam JN3]|uniref:Predicted protein n=1 Tax=Leptosphaeria maculans (strain JN3 / isolate v23.1.3 / race Av1-4-5-6-7-8) TaxID=985895 RepID=E4ZHD0_LEPMJ|nr:predicted protein [Plenodomus lingam JN3]CBX90700.1 predicted protein [Plenodomus lingam JN3]
MRMRYCRHVYINTIYRVFMYNRNVKLVQALGWENLGGAVLGCVRGDKRWVGFGWMGKGWSGRG